MKRRKRRLRGKARKIGIDYYFTPKQLDSLIASQKSHHLSAQVFYIYVRNPISQEMQKFTIQEHLLR